MYGGMGEWKKAIIIIEKRSKWSKNNKNCKWNQRQEFKSPHKL